MSQGHPIVMQSPTKDILLSCLTKTEAVDLGPAAAFQMQKLSNYLTPASMSARIINESRNRMHVSYYSILQYFTDNIF